MALFHQHCDEVGVGPILGDAGHVVVERRRRVDAEVCGGQLGVAQVAHQFPQVIDGVVDDAHGAGGERGVPTPLVFGRPLQHEHLGTALRAARAAHTAALPPPTTTTSAARSSDHDVICGSPSRECLGATRRTKGSHATTPVRSPRSSRWSISACLLRSIVTLTSPMPCDRNSRIYVGRISFRVTFAAVGVCRAARNC